MLHFSYNSGDMGIVDVQRLSFTMQILFFYDKNISFDQMHLLEHLLLHPRRKIKKGKLSLHNVMQWFPHIDALTAGNFLSLKLRCHVDDAEYLSEIMLDLITDALYLDEEIIAKEIQILMDENKKTDSFNYLLEKYTKNPMYPEVDLSQIAANPEMVMDWFLYTIKNNKPLILLSGNTHHESVTKAISNVNNRLQSQPEKRSNREIFYNANLPLGQKTHFGTGNKELIVFSSMPHMDPFNYFHHTLLFFMINELFFETFRVEEWTDYSPYWIDRNTLYSQEMVHSFTTGFDSKKLYDYMQNFFYKDKDFFELKKKKIAKIASLWQDQFSEYYQIAQVYFFTKVFRRSSYVVEQILSITYEDFMEYYKERFHYVSVYSSDQTKKDAD